MEPLSRDEVERWVLCAVPVLLRVRFLLLRARLVTAHAWPADVRTGAPAGSCFSIRRASRRRRTMLATTRTHMCVAFSPCEPARPLLCRRD